MRAHIKNELLDEWCHYKDKKSEGWNRWEGEIRSSDLVEILGGQFDIQVQS